MRRAAACAALLPLLAALAGCGGGPGEVRGTVTLDGRPVADATVTFVKSEGGLVREGAVVKDGSFRARLPPGRYKVEVNGRKVVGKRQQRGFGGELEEVELTEELFPARYNTKTELSEEVRPGRNTVTLDLKSKK